jgi:DNA excision repair protein ERCC-4
VNVENGQAMSLRIDFREQRSGILEELEKKSDHFTFGLCTLSTGDYWIGDRIIVERKTVTDLMDSIKSGRVFDQAYRMRQSGKNCLMIIEGDKTVLETSSMSDNAVVGALIHLTVFVGIPVIWSRNIGETAFILSDIYHQCRQQGLPRQKPVIHRTQGIKITNKQRQKLFLLQNLQGIGIKRGLALLRSFSTFENILNASPAELTKVNGIGNSLANRIFAILHEPF